MEFTEDLHDNYYVKMQVDTSSVPRHRSIMRLRRIRFSFHLVLRTSQALACAVIL